MNHTNDKNKKARILRLTAVCAALLTAAAVTTGCAEGCGRRQPEEDVNTETQPVTEPEKPFGETSLGNGIVVTQMFPYTGIFVEDGSDTPVSGIAACTVENNGPDAVQMLVFSLRASDGRNFIFEVSSLLPGQRVNVLEKSKETYDENAVGFTAYREAYAVYSEVPSLQPDKVQLFCSGSTIRVTNLTEETMKTCRVFFKYKQKNTFIGGVTFSVKLTDLKPDEPAVLTPSHYNEDNCEILFVTYD